MTKAGLCGRVPRASDDVMHTSRSMVRITDSTNKDGEIKGSASPLDSTKSASRLDDPSRDDRLSSHWLHRSHSVSVGGGPKSPVLARMADNPYLNYTPPSVEEILSTLPKWSKHEEQRTTFVKEQLKKKDKQQQHPEARHRKQSRGVAPPNCTEYVVDGNETLSGIALKHNVPVTMLVKINHLPSSAILPGQVIYIPNAEAVKKLTAQKLARKISAHSTPSASLSTTPVSAHRLGDDGHGSPYLAPPSQRGGSLSPLTAFVYPLSRLESLAQSLWSPLASYLSADEHPIAEDDKGTDTSISTVPDTPAVDIPAPRCGEPLADDEAKSAPERPFKYPCNWIHNKDGCIAGLLGVLPTAVMFEPLDPVAHHNHGLYLPFRQIAGLALTQVPATSPYVPMELDESPDEAGLEKHRDDWETGLAVSVRAPGTYVTANVVFDVHPDNVDYVFSRIMRGTDAAAADLARRASRTADVAEETERELAALPDVVKRSLTAGLPLDRGTAEDAVLEEESFLGDLPQMMVPSTLIDETVFNQLRSFLPDTVRFNDWVLMFNTETDGVSLTQLYRQVKAAGPLILLVKDDGGNIFGAFLSHELRLSDRTFYGNGDCFVFRVEPDARVFPWTGENEYFIKCELDQFHIGAGNGVFALWLDDTLHHGSSGTSLTFNNECLSHAPQFVCIKLEVWAFA